MTTPTLAEQFQVFRRIGLLSFGGPAAQIALMHKELVEERNWLDEDQFLGALSFCMLLPGPEAMQLATYTGWRLSGVVGGLIAGLLFVLPGAAIIMVLAWAYVLMGDLPLVQAAFLGIKAAVVIIVIQALRKVAMRALEGPLAYGLALAAFVAIYVLGVPFPLIIAAAAALGFATARAAPRPIMPINVSPGQSLRTALIWAAIWAAPVLLTLLFNADFLTDIALYFSKLAVLTFGGAYAVLAWMTQSVVAEYGWITTHQMIDALGLAETTPGPLILVTQFVGLLAGYGQGGIGLALLAGCLTLWVTFAPCFLWIFVGAPYVEWLLAQPRLNGALKAITAAVVGVIANLSLWFALHVLFGQLRSTSFGQMPELASFDAIAAGLTLLAAILIFGLRMGMIPTLALMTIVGLVTGFLPV